MSPFFKLKNGYVVIFEFENGGAFIVGGGMA